MSTEADERLEAFHLAKLALMNVHLLADLERVRASSREVARIVDARLGDDGVTGPISLLHQATFIQFSYVCLVWLWERVKADRIEDRIVRAAGTRFDPRDVLASVKGPRPLTSLTDLLRLMRNAISHARVIIGDGVFEFEDRNERTENASTRAVVTWAQLGALSEAVLFAVNDHFWPPAGR